MPNDAAAAMQRQLRRWIEHVDNLAARPGDGPDERLYKTLLVFLGVFLLLAGIGSIAYLLDTERRNAAWMAAAAMLVLAGSFIHLLLSKDRRLFQAVAVVSMLLVPFGLDYRLGGFAASGGICLWGLLGPLMALVLYGARTAAAWFAGFLGLALLSGMVDEASRALWYTENLLLFSCLVFILLRYFVVERGRMRAALEREHELLINEQEKSERLLLNILPGPIAERLKDKPQPIADSFAEVTVLFADIVGFTTLAARTPADEVVRMLNELFSRFDALSEKLGVEKIKTIGDAYMACAGLPVERPDHAKITAELALGMQRAVEDFSREQGLELQLRIGLNSGPVVAGVIGLKKFIYDLWGDTVNTASRMESHGLPGSIQVSAATHAYLKDDYRFESRGSIQVKGKGAVDTYLLLGPR